MTILLLRHARAGRRSAWKGDDEARPVSKVGRRQARDLAATFAGHGVTAILSSPYVRCRQTVEPLAKALGLPVERTDALAEGAELDAVLALLADLDDGVVVCCTHGDVAHLVLDHVRANGVKLRNPKAEKGSVWELEVRDGDVVAATYHRPPAP